MCIIFSVYSAAAAGAACAGWEGEERWCRGDVSVHHTYGNIATHGARTTNSNHCDAEVAIVLRLHLQAVVPDVSVLSSEVPITPAATDSATQQQGGKNSRKLLLAEQETSSSSISLLGGGRAGKPLWGVTYSWRREHVSEALHLLCYAVVGVLWYIGAFKQILLVCRLVHVHL
jgi:hypothetical protein